MPSPSEESWRIEHSVELCGLRWWGLQGDIIALCADAATDREASSVSAQDFLTAAAAVYELGKRCFLFQIKSPLYKGIGRFSCVYATRASKKNIKIGIKLGKAEYEPL